MFGTGGGQCVGVAAVRVRRFSTGVLVVGAAALVLATVGGPGEGSDGPGGAAVDALKREGVLVGTRCVGRGCWDGPLPRWVLAVWASRAVGLVP